MAHLQKLKRSGVAPMMRHYRREMGATLERSNIDAGRTHLNYVVGEQLRGLVESRIEHAVTSHNAAGRALRQDAVLMADWVVTRPQNVPEGRTEEFFRACHAFIRERYGTYNVPCGYVHMDEATPHMHVPVIPFDLEERRFRASALMGRADLKSFHGQLGDYLEARMGFRPDVELEPEQKREKAVRYGSLDEYKDRRDALAALDREIAQATERLESVRRAWEGTRGTPLTDFREAREERALDREIERLEGEIAEQERGIGRIEQAIVRMRERVGVIGERIRELVEKVAPLREFDQRAAENTRRVAEQFSRIYESQGARAARADAGRNTQAPAARGAPDRHRRRGAVR